MSKPLKAIPQSDQPEGGIDHVQFLNNAWRSSEDAWRTRRVHFDESWALFWNRYDFSKKAPWQSKNFSPKMTRMVRQAAYTFKQALVGLSDYFVVDGVGKKSRDRAWVVAKILKFWLEENNFISIAVDSIFASLLSSIMVFKVYWETTSNDEVVAPSKPTTGAEKLSVALAETSNIPKGVIPEALQVKRRVRGRLRIDAIDPNRIRMDPTGRKKFYIHEFDMDLHDLKELAKVPANKYEVEVVESIEEDFRKMEEEVREKLRRGEQPVSEQNRTFRRQIVVREYWGEIFDNKGNLVGRNMTFSVANEKYEIRKPMKNPQLPNELPFVVGAPLRVPFSNFHQSFGEIINGLCRVATEILNLTLDANLWASIKAFELDLDQVVDPNQFKNGVYPGKVFTKRNRGVPRAMVTPLEMGSVNPQNQSFYNVIGNEVQNSTGINEFTAGFTGGRKVETATEVNVKGAQSEGYMNSIASEVEENVFDPLLKKAWDTGMAHMGEDDFSSEELRELLGDDVADLLVFLSDAGRADYFKGTFKFRFRGMSAMMEKGKDLDKCQMVVDAVQKLPGVTPLLDQVALVRKFFASLNWNPEEFLLKATPPPPAGSPSTTPPTPGAPGSPSGINPATLAAALGGAHPGTLPLLPPPILKTPAFLPDMAQRPGG